VPCPAHVGPFQGLHVNLIARLSDNLSDRGPEEVPKPAHQPSVLYLHPCRSLIADLMHLARWLRDTLRVQDTLTLFLFPTLFECKKRLETAAVTHSAWHTRGYCFIHRPRPTRMSFLSGVAVWPTSLQCRRTLLSTLHMPATTWRHAAVLSSSLHGGTVACVGAFASRPLGQLVVQILLCRNTKKRQPFHVKQHQTCKGTSVHITRTLLAPELPAPSKTHPHQPTCMLQNDFPCPVLALPQRL